MRIAFIFHDAGVYGAPKSLLDLIDGLRNLGAGISCYAILPEKGPLLQEIENRKIEYQIIHYKRWVHKMYDSLWVKIHRSIRRFPDNRLLRAVTSLFAAYQIKRHLENWQVDIVYTNTSVIVVGALAASLAHKKHVWHIREFQEIDQKLRLDWGKKMFTKIIAKTDAVVFISKALRQYYQPWVLGVRTEVIYNGVATHQDFIDISNRKENFRRKNHTFTFCIVGRISHEKAQHEAVQAVSLLVKEGWDLQLLIAGKGDAKPIEALIQELQLQPYVRLVGHVDDPYEHIYFQSDACLMCSAHEGFGRVTVEAMACALPVIGKSVKYTGTVELISHNQTGILYEGNEVALAKAMKQLLINPEWSRQLGQNAWEYAKNHLNRENYVEQVYKLLKSL